MHQVRMSLGAVFCCLLRLLPVIFLPVVLVFAQTDSGTVSGRVVDPSGSIIVGAQVVLVDIDRETTSTAVTNNAGLYAFHVVRPGRYRLEVSAKDFKVVNVTGLIVNTQANLEQNFTLSVGSVSESITVEAKANEVSTAVSTVVDRQFVENIPLNGRSFQTLIQLTPGVVVTPTSNTDSGQFSVNGQRASANYFMVDGVSANIGASANPFSTQNAAGTMPGLSVLGGTNNLVSVDALQEFRIQTSSYAPEFGRTPGAQISIETRSGTNQFHGTVFDYLRNDVLDANNWFNGTTNPPLPKSKERQNDFGGVFGGPIFKNRTFFFFSYEQQILRLPRTGLSKVPSLAVRQNPATPAAILPLLNGYPVPNGPQSAADVGSQIAPFAASFSDPSTLKAASLRIDHKVSDRLAIFGRYNYSPSDLEARGGSGSALNAIARLSVRTETLTLGTVWSPATSVTNDLRFNYSRNRSSSEFAMDSFGGAVVPGHSFFLPATFGSKRPNGALSIFSIGGLPLGPLVNQLQRQINLVEGFSLQRGHHAIKLGVDYRRLSPNVSQPDYQLSAAFLNVASAVLLRPSSVSVNVREPVTILFHNLGAYAQDTWRTTSRLSLTYGLRWDVDFAPSTAYGPDFLALTNVGAPTTLAIAPPGSPLFRTRYNSFAPRVGLSYLLFPEAKYETVLRGGFGVFYDLATPQAEDSVTRTTAFPFGAGKSCTASTSLALCGASLTFPLPAAIIQPAPIALSPTQLLIGFDPDLRLPYTLQWNVALEQSLGEKQVVSTSYVGAVGRRLIEEQDERAGARFVVLIGNHGTSDYHALQFQFRRQMSRGLQALASYAWAHSIDTASASTFNFQNLFVAGLNPNFSRSPSDFDVRHSFSAGVTYRVPDPASDAVFKAIAGGWSLDSMIQGRSATPVDVTNTNLIQVLGASLGAVRPDLVPGQPLFLTGAACSSPCAGGKVLNPKAFVNPPQDPVTGLPLREGNLGRNALRGFGAFQWDIAVSRTFGLGEKLHLLFRGEFFNVLNRPNFASPVANLANSFFGRSIQTLNQGLNTSSGLGDGFSPLYQIGGPRSGQLALKLSF